MDADFVRDYLESDALLGPYDVVKEWTSEYGTLDGLDAVVFAAALDALENYPYQDRINDLMNDMCDVFALTRPDSERSVVGKVERLFVSHLVDTWRSDAVQALVEAGADREAAEVEVALGGVPMPEGLRQYFEWLKRSGL